MTTRTPDQDFLLERLRNHLSQLDTKFRFANRLAKENEWTLGFTYEVINEYAKFLFLAKEGGDLVVPPPIIDRAWHLHLLYTEAYWNELCPNILGTPLHHHPATESKDESVRLANSANQTISSYRRFFGEPHAVWYAPQDKINRPLLRNVGYLLSGTVVGLMLFSAWTGFVSYAVVGALLFAAPAIFFFALASFTPAIKSVHPKVHDTVRGPATCGGNSCAAQGNSGSGDVGGHGGHSCSGGH